MHYYEVEPDVRLRPFVRCLWGLRGPVPRQVERVLPDGCCEFVVHCGDAFLQQGTSGLQAQPRELFVGPSERALRIQPGAVVDVVAIRFRPGGAAILLSAPLSEYREVILARSDCDIRPGLDLIDCLSPLADAQRVRVLEGLLLERRKGLAVDASIRHVRRRISETRGSVRIDALSRETGLTMRQLQRRFDAVVGLSPKGLSRVIRLQHALSLAREGGRTLARIAALSGYADQAHFNRQFRDIAGVTPTEYFTEQNQLDVYFASE